MSGAVVDLVVVVDGGFGVDNDRDRGISYSSVKGGGVLEEVVVKRRMK